MCKHYKTRMPNESIADWLKRTSKPSNWLEQAKGRLNRDNDKLTQIMKT